MGIPLRYRTNVITIGKHQKLRLETHNIIPMKKG